MKKVVVGLRVYISADMEGITGVSSREDCAPSGRDKTRLDSYTRFRRMMTQDVNAAIEGAIESGADEILVNDAHYEKSNILIEELHEEAQLISGLRRPYGMAQGLDDHFDAAFLIGYHAMPGTLGSIATHVQLPQVVDMTINDKLVGEIALVAYFAGWYNVPVVLVTGDDKAAKEAEELIQNVVTVKVKEGIGRFTAKLLSPKKTYKMIKEGAKEALASRNRIKPLKIALPIKFEATFPHTNYADAASNVPGIVREGPRKISYDTDDYVQGYKHIVATLEDVAWGALDDFFW